MREPFTCFCRVHAPENHILYPFYPTIAWFEVLEVLEGLRAGVMEVTLNPKRRVLFNRARLAGTGSGEARDAQSSGERRGGGRGGRRVEVQTPREDPFPFCKWWAFFGFPLNPKPSQKGTPQSGLLPLGFPLPGKGLCAVRQTMGCERLPILGWSTASRFCRMMSIGLG